MGVRDEGFGMRAKVRARGGVSCMVRARELCAITEYKTVHLLARCPILSSQVQMACSMCGWAAIVKVRVGGARAGVAARSSL